MGFNRMVSRLKIFFLSPTHTYTHWKRSRQTKQIEHLQVDVISHAGADQRPVPDLIPPDPLRVRLEAILVPGHGRDGDGDVVRGPIAGRLEREPRVAAVHAALVTGAQVAVAADQAARRRRVEAHVRHVDLADAVQVVARVEPAEGRHLPGREDVALWGRR